MPAIIGSIVFFSLQLAWIALLVWWLAAGDIFRAKPTNDGAKAAIGFVIFFICVGLVYTLYHQRTRMRASRDAG